MLQSCIRLRCPAKILHVTMVHHITMACKYIRCYKGASDYDVQQSYYMLQRCIRLRCPVKILDITKVHQIRMSCNLISQRCIRSRCPVKKTCTYHERDSDHVIGERRYADIRYHKAASDHYIL